MSAGLKRERRAGQPRDLVDDRKTEPAAFAASVPFKQLVTTSAVLTEVANFMGQSHERQAFVELVEALFSSADVSIAESSDLWRRGLELFAGRLDKEWSLTDCVSFVVMTDGGIRDALTGDRHFDQAGFNALLK